jgi:putative hemolysin
VQPPQEQAVTEEEIHLLLAQGIAAGVLAEQEHAIVQRVFRVADRRVATLMTPRPQVVWLDVNDDAEENARRMAASPHGQFPVCAGDLDHALGLVAAKDVWARAARGEPSDLRKGLQAAVFIPEHLPALRALEQLQTSGTHAALVLDEYGGTVGIVTLIDVLEALVGASPGPAPEGERAIVQRADGSWLVDGLTPVAELAAVTGIDVQAEAAREGYQTMGGCVLAWLGRLPATGDTVERQGVRVEVVDMDGQRVDKVLIHAPLTTERAR